MKLIKFSAAATIAACLVTVPALADTTNGYGVGTSAVTGQYLDRYGTVESNGAAYRMGGDSSGNYTVMRDVAPANFEQCTTLAPGTCTASQGGTTGPGFNQTYSNSNAGLNFGGGLAGASTYANLSTGKLGGSGSTSYYQTAKTVADYVDTLTFNVAGANASTSTDIVVKFQLDGGLFAPDAPMGTPGLGTRGASVQDAFSLGHAFGQVNFNLVGANPTYASPTTLTQYTSEGGWTSFSWDTVGPGLTQFTGVYSLSGISQTLGIRNSLSAFATSGGSFAYGSTSSLNFILPSNVTFTSASGTFLSALVPPSSGAVPEPATWAMMLAGFGLIGFGMRRRSTEARVRFV